MKRWKEYRNPQLSTDDTMQDLQLFERDLWVETSLNNKRRPYGFGAEGLVMKQHA